MFPLRIGTFMLWRPWQTDRDLSELLKNFENSSLSAFDPINVLKQALPDQVPLKVTEIIPRLKDGGAFVKFTYTDETSPKDTAGKYRSSSMH